MVSMLSVCRSWARPAYGPVRSVRTPSLMVLSVTPWPIANWSLPVLAGAAFLLHPVSSKAMARAPAMAPALLRDIAISLGWGGADEPTQPAKRAGRAVGFEKQQGDHGHAERELRGYGRAESFGTGRGEAG